MFDIPKSNHYWVTRVQQDIDFTTKKEIYDKKKKTPPYHQQFICQSINNLENKRKEKRRLVELYTQKLRMTNSPIHESRACKSILP